MPVTYRRELLLECDNQDSLEYDCHRELMLDQLDARTKAGMEKYARRRGWVIQGNMCLCPHCSSKMGLSDLLRGKQGRG